MSARKIRQALNVQYLDQELIQQSLHNCINHYYDLENVIDVRSGNMFLNPSQSYSATNINFLFLASDIDVRVTIDGNKHFDVMQFVLVQRNVNFDFSIQPQIVPMNCTVNIHFLHGKIAMSD